MERTTISFVCVFTLCCFTLPRNTLAQAPYSPIFMLIQSAFGSDEYRLPNERLDPIFGALERGEYDLAIGMCNEAIRDSKESWAPAYILRGQVWLKKGDYDNAFADFNRAIQVDPKCAAAYMHRGETWARMGEYDRAIADYDQAIRTDPGYAFSYHRRGDAWYLKGQ